MILKISHIGIAVKDITASSEMYSGLLNSQPSEMEVIEEQKVKVVKFQVGESAIELLQGTSEDSPITKFILKRGEGIHHIAYETDGIEEELLRIESKGFELINKNAQSGSDDMKIAFINPKSAGGVLTEICQHK